MSDRPARRRLTLEQRAARTTRMKTKKLLATNPLLASELTPDGALADWLTTPDREATRIRRIEEAWQDRQIHMRDVDEAHSDRALSLRDLVASRVDPATLAALDERRRIYPASPAYSAEYWYARLREVDQPTAAAHCEHDHTQMARWYERCPRCCSMLEQPARPPEAVQMQIGEGV